jgi:hypothetical protein
VCPPEYSIFTNQTSTNHAPVLACDILKPNPSPQTKLTQAIDQAMYLSPWLVPHVGINPASCSRRNARVAP